MSWSFLGVFKLIGKKAHDREQMATQPTGDRKIGSLWSYSVSRHE